MSKPSQTGKRFVSQGEYVKAQGKRASKGLLATCLYVAAVACGLLTAFLIFVLYQAVMLYRQEPEKSSGIGLMLGFVITVAFGAGTWLFRKSALRIIKQAKEMEVGVPLTRANTADLPAPESLMRASEEPVEVQQTMLLRAATDTQQMHEDQLVRASIEKDSPSRR